MRPPETLETERLRLRPPVMEDAPSIFAYAQDREVTRYLTWSPHEDVERTRHFLMRALSAWENETGFPWVLVRKQDGQLIGMVELRIRGHKAEVGYVLARPFWGQGYMSEAVRALIDWALAQPGLYRIWAVCDVENRASARVLEKSGMQREGVLRRWTMHPNLGDVPRDCYCYALVK